LPAGYGAFIIELKPEIKAANINHIHLFIFNVDGKLIERFYLESPEAVASRYFPYVAGYYTAIVVANVNKDFMPVNTNISLPDFVTNLNSQTGDYPGLISGMAQAGLTKGEVKRLSIPLKNGMEGIVLSTLRLVLKLPSPHLPEPLRLSRTSETAYALHCVIEVCNTGSDEIFFRQECLPMLSEDGNNYIVDLILDKGTYDIRLWADYVPEKTPSGYFYTTTGGLKFVTLVTDPYRANTDNRDAFYANLSSISITENIQQETVNLERPLAKYRIIATDVERYIKLVETNNFPPLDELKATVFYEGFVPNSFNVITGSPNDAITGLNYESELPVPGMGEDKVQIGSDWLFVNGNETFVKVTVAITDSQGDIVSQASGIQINYRRGYLTTVGGQFLTAGKTSGGIDIDTEWEDDFIIGF